MQMLKRFKLPSNEADFCYCLPPSPLPPSCYHDENALQHFTLVSTPPLEGEEQGGGGGGGGESFNDLPYLQLPRRVLPLR